MTKILDCTIRDGGYLNNWEFSDAEVLALIDCAQKNSIEYFEIGYRSNKNGSKFLSCANENIAKLAIPKCNVTYIDGEEMQTTLYSFLNAIYSVVPSNIGGKLPNNNFYYIAE